MSCHVIWRMLLRGLCLLFLPLGVAGFVRCRLRDAHCMHACMHGQVSLELDFVSALAGVATSLAIIPIQGFLVRYIGGLRRNTAQNTDERVRLTGEVIQVWGGARACCLA